MEQSSFGKSMLCILGLIGGFIGSGLFDGLKVIARRFPEVAMLIVAIVIAFILVILAFFLMRIQGPTRKKIGIALGVIAICIAIVLFYLFDQDYFVQDTWRVLAPVSGVVLLFGGGAVSLSSYFSMLDQQHRDEENEKSKQ